MLVNTLQTLLLLTAAGTLPLAGCDRHGGPQTAQSSSQALNPASSHDPCSLLDSKEVETVLGAPLATPPFIGYDGKPAEASSGVENAHCVYEDAAFHNIMIQVTWEDGARVWKWGGMAQGMANKGPAKGMLHLADGTDLAGEWDEARISTGTILQALRGDQIVEIDFGGSKAQIQDAAKLADAALKRLDHPLAINGPAGAEAAKIYEAAHRPKRCDPCALITRADAEALMGGTLDADPKSNGDSCEYYRTVEGLWGSKLRTTVELEVQWTDGFRELRKNTAMVQGLLKGMSAGLQANEKQAVESIGGNELPASPSWEAAATGARPGQYYAVKNDVMISVDTLGLAKDAPKNAPLRMLEKAMSRL